VVEKYVFDNPWIFMNHLLSQLQQSDVQYDLKAVVTDVLVDLHVIINGDINADQKNIDRKRCCKRYSFTVPFDGVDTPIILLPKKCVNSQLMIMILMFSRTSLPIRMV
jgi:hypothetical protein